MAKIHCRAAAHRMRNTYGEISGECCEFCCNRQKNNRVDCIMVCIAYSDRLPWEASETACGLYNTPFRGLRPVRMPLQDYLQNRRNKDSIGLVNEDQESFFDTSEGGKQLV